MWGKCAVLFAAFLTTLPAQTWEVAPFAGYMRISSKPIGSLNATARDDDTTVKARQPGYGVRVAWNTKGYYGLEGGYLRNRARVDSKIVPPEGIAAVQRSGIANVNQLFFNGVSYFMPNGERFRPFMTAGVQVQFWGAPPITDWSGGGSRSIGFNYGGGVKIRLVKQVLARFDVRDIWVGAPYGLRYAEDPGATAFRSPGLLRQLEGSFGLSFVF